MRDQALLGETASSELDRPLTLVNPTTGEALTLDSPTEDLATYLADVRDLEAAIREHKRAVNDELLSRLDRSASWTAHLPGLKLTAPSPAPVEEWDGAELRTALLELVDEGLLTIDAVDAAVQTVVTYKPRKSGITALRKLGGRVRTVVDDLCRQEEPTRYVRVTRA